MDKWADYGISGVRFNMSHTHIDQVQINPDTGASIGPPAIHRRGDVIDAIKKARRLSLYFATQATSGIKGSPYTSSGSTVRSI